MEGPTEEKFVKELIAPAFGTLGVSIVATTYGRPRRQGGVPAWGKAKREILGLLKQDTGRHVTTMFDYFRMPLDWPGRRAAVAEPYGERADMVEEQMRAGIATAMEGKSATCRFIPYVQMHEFEALLFSNPELLGEVVSRDRYPKRLIRELERIANAFRTPEEIDDGPMSAPSKRILALATEYQKVTDGNSRGEPHRSTNHETEMPAL